ncbi:hypothetical protein RHMOL_Rhmol03G0129700 [Rhododendron molle]|uniref:Uncharacterized protein n=1 Tax=Rhododendron molle TaxID=49168 RepID=A0ACC0PFA2_RHOML|nr:hypothetical protein RHMOL_Rhmol03G0129700 [Rhododendron molle]
MGMPQADGKMEGWLYLIRFNRFGLQYSRKRYFILEDNCLKSFKSKPNSDMEEPVRSAIIDSCIRVTDNGRESFHRKVFFIFSLYNTSNHNDQLKFGASSPEEAARWIRSLQDAAINPAKNLAACSKRKWQPFRMSMSKRAAHKKSIEWTSASCKHMYAMTSDNWEDHPAIMAVGVVDGTSESVFRTLMSLGPSRSEWDFCFHRASVVEHLDGHTEIIHMQLNNEWLPWLMKRRDLLLRRYWRREDDGTYVILYHSVFHRKCPPQNGYVRANLKSNVCFKFDNLKCFSAPIYDGSCLHLILLLKFEKIDLLENKSSILMFLFYISPCGGFVIRPVNQGKESVVKHMLSIDWKFWRSYIRKASARSVTIRMLERVSALRELFTAKAGNYYSYEFSYGEMTKDIGLTQSEKESVTPEVKRPEEIIDTEEGKMEVELENNVLSGTSSLRGLNDAADEFFDVPEPSDDDHEHEWLPDLSPKLHYPDAYQPRLSSAAGFVKKLHGLTAQKKGYMDLHEVAWEENVSRSYGATLAKDPGCNLPCSWTTADPSTFLIRGETYLQDNQKVKAKGSLMQMVAADWIRSDKREDDLGSRPGGIVQKYAAQGGPQFFLIVNIQVPGSTTYGLALYFMTKTPLEETPILERFVNGDDAYRNSRFKLIPYISKGSWIVKQSVGKKACLVGQALEINYHRGKNYLELGVDVGSSTVARGVVSLVLGYLNNLVIEMAFLIQADTQEELPERLLGMCRLNHLDISKTVVVTP